MAAYRRVDGLKSPAGRLPVHRDQLPAQRSVTIMGELRLSPLPDDNLRTLYGITYVHRSSYTNDRITHERTWSRDGAGGQTWSWVGNDDARMRTKDW